MTLFVTKKTIQKTTKNPKEASLGLLYYFNYDYYSIIILLVDFKLELELSKLNT